MTHILFLCIQVQGDYRENVEMSDSSVTLKWFGVYLGILFAN